MRFNIFWRAQPFCYFVDLLGYWDALSYQRLNLLDIPADVALVQVKQKVGQRVGYVKAVICKQHQKPVFNIQLEMPACTYGSFPAILSIGQSPDLMPAVFFCHLIIVNVIELLYSQTGE